MALAPDQLTQLKADIEADPVLGALPETADNADLIATVYNQDADPDVWVWHTALAPQTIYETTTPEATAWSWGLFISRSQGEREAWSEMTRGGSLNMALPNARAGIDNIFSGGPGAAQRTHVYTVGRVRASRAEAVLAEGPGSTASPATRTFQGELRYQDVLDAWAQP